MKKILLILAVIVAVFLLALSNSSNAYTIYDNGENTGGTGVAAKGIIISYALPADDFILESDSIANGADVIFGIHESVSWDNSIEWMFFDDNGGSPGSIVNFGVGSNFTINSSSTVPPLNSDIVDASFDFGEDVNLAANTKYWFGIHALGVTGGWNGLGWRTKGPSVGEDSKSISIPLLKRNDVLGDFYSDINLWGSTGTGGVDLSFRLNGINAIPEPTTVTLLGIGLVGLVGAEVRRRRKKKAVLKR